MTGEPMPLPHNGMHMADTPLHDLHARTAPAPEPRR